MRLVLGLILGTTSLLALNGSVIYAVAKQRLYGEFDELLVEVLKSNLSSITRSVRPRGEQYPPAAPFPELAEREEYLLQVWGRGGRAVLKSEHLGEQSLPRLAQDLEAVLFEDIDSQALSIQTLPLPDGSMGRAAALMFRPPPPPRGSDDRPRPFGGAAAHNANQIGYELVLARDTSSLRETLAALGWLLTIAWASSSAGCAAILTWIVTRGLRPLERLRARIQGLHEDRLDHEISLPRCPGPVTQSAPCPIVLRFSTDRLR